MGTDKRQRQKLGRRARVEAAVEAQRQAQQRRRIIFGVALVAFVAVIVALVLILRDDDGDETAATTTTEASGSVAGQPCVEVSEPLPEGAPPVDVPVGPPPDELVIEDIVEGDGEAVTDPDMTVTVNYIGVSCSTGVVFDSSWARGEPVTFPLAGVIPGWTEGIQGMRVGGQRLLVIPPEMGYGDAGNPPDIAPGETLVFVVDLVAIGADEAAVPEPPPPGEELSGPTPCPEADGSSARTTGFAEPPPMCIDPATSYTATFDTTAGQISVRLDAEGMPETTNNFVVLARYHYYDQTAIFRSDPSIDILQGGSPHTNSAADPGPGYSIDDEGGEFDFSDPAAPRGPFTYEPGQLVMARTAQPNSSGAQFFLTGGPNVSNLDSQGTYLLFGEIVAGLEVVQAILATHQPDTTGSGLGGSPSPPVVVNSVTIEES
jgi:cyclophilin family peptidyl-prolyl cis-trans isomerase